MTLVRRRSGGVGVDRMTGKETLPMGLGGGVFLDRHGSLLASVTTSEVASIDILWSTCFPMSFRS